MEGKKKAAARKAIMPKTTTTTRSMDIREEVTLQSPSVSHKWVNFHPAHQNN
jgi:hypothetical protein